jgi:hypothetical protein
MARHCSGEDTANTEVWEIDTDGNTTSLLMQAATFALALDLDEKKYTIEHTKTDDDESYEVIVFTVTK